MMMKKVISSTFLIRGLFIFILATGIIGCASKMPVTSGFLENYSSFKESEDYKGIWIYKHPTRGFAEFDAFIIDPISVYLRPKSFMDKIDLKEIGIKADKLQELTEYFQRQIIKQLKNKKFKIVNEPGERVARIKIAITDVDANIPALNVYGYQKYTGIGMGSAAMEAEAIDSMTEERIVAIIDYRKGSKIPKFNRDGKSMSEKAHESYDNMKDSWTKWGTVKKIMEKWAIRFANRLDKARAGQPMK